MNEKQTERKAEYEQIIVSMIKQREKLGFSQEKMAELSGYSKSYIANLEAMKTLPSISVLFDLLHVLEMDFTVSAK